ncbi:hypothetical protein F5Y19DRAFT_470873 [Xylariaceae sp. FL1651]|nr:hypothetical protein F5Y19DRAFT_470873 [Xylariaceae sp. FL1651]
MGTEAAKRLEAELDLLLAMYPESLNFSSKSRELKYSYFENYNISKSPAVLLLRLPDTYPLNGSPQIISASGFFKEDLRSVTKAAFQSIEAPAGEEVLDALLFAFKELVLSQAKLSQNADSQRMSQPQSGRDNVLPDRTVIIWLHHLLNTNKRKLALNPSMASSRISGIVKPGYPGMLIFSGEGGAIDSHVSELRNQRWQAFQVRYDTNELKDRPEPWKFKHGMGIREVEFMSDVAQGIIGDVQREIFLSSIGVK